MRKPLAHLLTASGLAFALGAAAHAQTPPPPPAAHAHGAHQMSMPEGRYPMTRADMDMMVKNHFAQVDSNRDGYVTREEITAMRGTHMRASMDDMFRRIDSNSDGQISRAEFDAHHAGHMGGHEAGGDMDKMRADKMRADKMYKDKAKAPKAPMPLMGGPAFDEADSNKDGKLSLAEVQSLSSAHFTSMDSNKDGTISRDEQKSARKAMREEKRAVRKR